MDHTTLAAAVEALKTPYLAERDALLAKIEAVISSTMVEMKIDKLASLKMRGLESAEVVVPCPNSYGHTVDIYFYTPWESKDKKRKVKMNTCTFGSFDGDDQPAVDYYVVAGALASSLKTLQKKFDALDESDYKTAYDAFTKARYELEQFEKDIKDRERQEQVKAIESKLVAGAKLRVGYNWNKEPIYDTIARVTSKNIVLEKDYGHRTKKENAVSNIILKKWEFA